MSSETTTTNPPLELDPCVEPIVLLSQWAADWLGVPRVRSMVYNQKWNIPPGPEMFQVFSVVSDQPYASGLSYASDPVTGDLQETIGTNCRSIVQWELWSRNADARLRRFKACAFLHSTACQQLCEQHGFAIASAPSSFGDLSYLDGSARVNRFQLTFSVLTGDSQTRTVESFGHFPGTPAFTFNR